MRRPLLISTALFLASASCVIGTVPKECAATCDGCCDEAGECHSGTDPRACGAVGALCHRCAEAQVCQLPGTCVAPTTLPDAAVDAGRDAGGPGGADGGVDAGLPDAGADAGAADAGRCSSGLIDNGGFECGLDGWTVFEGTGRIITQDPWEGSAALEVVADGLGHARAGLVRPLSFSGPVTLCLSARVRGTAPTVQLEVLAAPSNVETTFSSPVFSTWLKVPPSGLQVMVPPTDEVWVVVRATRASAGDVMVVDGLQVTESVNGHCPP